MTTYMYTPTQENTNLYIGNEIIKNTIDYNKQNVYYVEKTQDTITKKYIFIVC